MECFWKKKENESRHDHVIMTCDVDSPKKRFFP